MKKLDRRLSLFYTIKRERCRLRRLSITKSSKPNKFRPVSKRRINIVIPSDLDLEENRDEFFNLINEIQKALLNRKNFLIDHRNLKSITKEALLILTAEIERCTTIVGIKLSAKCRYTPKNSYVNSLLKKIGYWDYFNIELNDCRSTRGTSNELYLKIVGDTVVSGRTIGDLISFFEELISFDIDTRDKFSDAMMEAAANTVEHAYSKEQETRTINKWWLTASLNTETDEISFVFYDQGLGVLNTLESSQSHSKLRKLFTRWIAGGLSKGEILKKLVTTNLSSYKDERRGNGLISFKTFIDQVEDGELTIHTDNVSYSSTSDKICKYNNSISGTLIVWQIKANHHEDKCMYIKGLN